MDGLNCKVSILVPVYGVEGYIERCAESLFEQNYSNIEYVFVDDCTIDDSIAVLLQVLEKYPCRKEQVKIVRHDSNRGLAAARNTAFDNSTGEYVMHVDSDDFIESNAVELLLKCAREKNADIVVCDNKCVYKDFVTVRKQDVPPMKQDYLKFLLCKRIQPSIWGKLLSRNLYLKSNVRSVEGLNYGEDYVFIPRIVYYADVIVKLDCFLYNYVLYNNSAYTKNISLKAVANLHAADDILDEFFTSVPDSDSYVETLIISKLRTKLYLLKTAQVEIWDSIARMYFDLSSYSYLLTIPDRLILKLADSKCFKLLIFVLAIRQFLQKFRRRIL